MATNKNPGGADVPDELSQEDIEKALTPVKVENMTGWQGVKYKIRHKIKNAGFYIRPGAVALGAALLTGQAAQSTYREFTGYEPISILSLISSEEEPKKKKQDTAKADKEESKVDDETADARLEDESTADDDTEDEPSTRGSLRQKPVKPVIKHTERDENAEDSDEAEDGEDEEDNEATTNRHNARHKLRVHTDEEREFNDDGNALIKKMESLKEKIDRGVDPSKLEGILSEATAGVSGLINKGSSFISEISSALDSVNYAIDLGKRLIDLFLFWGVAYFAFRKYLKLAMPLATALYDMKHHPDPALIENLENYAGTINAMQRLMGHMLGRIDALEQRGGIPAEDVAELRTIREQATELQTATQDAAGTIGDREKK